MILTIFIAAAMQANPRPDRPLCDSKWNADAGPAALHRDRPLSGDLFGMDIAVMRGGLTGDKWLLVVGEPSGSVRQGSGTVYLVEMPEGALHATLEGTTPHDGFGSRLLAQSDINGDGSADLLVIASREGNDGGALVHAYDGLSFRLRYTAPLAASPSRSLGKLNVAPSCCGLPDLNDDGCDEFAVAMPFGIQDKNEPKDGAVDVFSGSSGQRILRILDPASAGGRFGSSIARIDDCDRDGYDDLIVGSIPALSASARGLKASQQSSRVYVFSSKSGKLVMELDLSRFGATAAGSVSSFPDLDGDGVRDILLAETWPSQSPTIRALSSCTGQILREWSQPALSRLGEVVVPCNDLNSDGVPEILATAPGVPIGHAVILSGSSNRLLNILESRDTDNGFGVSAIVVPDINEDGLPDFAIGAARSEGQDNYVGIVRVFCAASAAPLAEITLRSLIR